MCDSQQCPRKDTILIPEAVEFGGTLFFGHSPISKQWLVARFIFLILSLMILFWSISYHILNHKLLEWFYWMNNWSLLLSSIYLSLSFIVTYKIYKFVNQQQSKLCNLSPYNPKTKMMNETTSFALKSPSTNKYKSISQIDNEESIIIDHDDLNGDDDEKEKEKPSDPNSVSLGISVDGDGIDKHDDEHHDIEHNINDNDDDDNDDIDDNDNVSVHSSDSSASSYSSTTINLVKLNNDSDATYNSFKIDKTNNLNITTSHSEIDDLLTPYYMNNDIIFWLFTVKRMKIIGLTTMHKKFIQTVMSLNMVAIIVYIAFIYEYDVDLMNGIQISNKYEILFSFLVNSNLLQSIILLIEYYSSALRMNYNGFVYPVFIGICYCIMSIIFSVSQFDINNTSNTHQIDNLLNVSIGKIYLIICCDWIGNPMHALLHILSIILILILFHILFTATKNMILSHIWSYHKNHHHHNNNDNDDEFDHNNHGFDDDIYRTTMHINGNNMDYENDIKIIQKTEICDINMDNIEESSIVLDASISAISSSIVEVQYDHNKHNKSLIRSRIMSISDVDIKQNLTILEEHDNDIIIADDDHFYYQNQKEGHNHNDQQQI